jgi:hypothetical protein
MASAILASSPEQLQIRKHFLATLGQACQRTGWRVHVFVLCSLLLTSTGCEKHAATQSMSTASQESGQTKLDVCGLIEKAEIEAIQGSPIKETKSSARPEGDLRVSQCFYTEADFSRSVTLALFQRSVALRLKLIT